MACCLSLAPATEQVLRCRHDIKTGQFQACTCSRTGSSCGNDLHTCTQPQTTQPQLRCSSCCMFEASMIILASKQTPMPILMQLRSSMLAACSPRPRQGMQLGPQTQMDSS